jgi:hypothetical protein
MFIENSYIHFSSKLLINSISNYKSIMTKFINQYIEFYKDKYSNKKELVTDSIIYSKYYLYYKTKNCLYSDSIMEIIYDIEFSFNHKS